MQPVLIGQWPLELQQVWALLQSSGSSPEGGLITHLVVLDRQQPIGCVPLARFFGPAAESLILAESLESITCLSAETPIRQFWEHLQRLPITQQPLHWGVTDTDTGDFLGLVDLQRLLPQLAHALSTPEDDLESPLQAQAAYWEAKQQRQDELLAEISHDLKNPLTAILGLLNILQQYDVDPLTEKQRHYLELIDEKAHQITALVKQMVHLSQAQSTGFKPQLEIVDLPALCTQVIEGQTADIQFYIDEHVPPLIADPNCLRPILQFLLQQAQTSAAVTLRVEPWGGWIGFEIAATSKVPTSTNTEPVTPEISRLEQHLIRHLAHQQGGVIFHSPARYQAGLLIPSNLAAMQSDRTLAPQLSRQLVVVIAKAPGVIEMLRLGSSAYRLVVAPTGVDAVATVRQLQPAVVFLHLALPALPGWTMLTLLKHHVPQVPVVVLGEAAQQQQANQQGAQMFVSPPWNEQIFQQCLQTIAPLAEASSFSTAAVETNGEERGENIASHSLSSLSVEPSAAPSKLTVLHWEAASPNTSPSLSQRLNRQGCRVIATESAEEATLLAQIWKPRVILYTGSEPTVLQHLEPESPLVQIPFVIVEPAVFTQVRKIPNLTVYECSAARLQTTEIAVLVQVLQVAAGVL